MDPDVTYARALATAFAADIDNPSIAGVIQRGGLTQDQFTSIVYRDIQRGLTGAPGPALFPSVRAFARQVVGITAIKQARSYGLSQASSDIGGAAGLVGAIAGAVGAIWSTKINTDSQKNLAKIQANEAQITQNSQTLAAQSALIQNATANGVLLSPAGGVTPVTAIGPSGTLTAVSGLPVLAIGTALAAMVFGGYFFAKG
jgi:hypothetical protein